MNDIQELNEPYKRPQRPKFLLILVILSSINIFSSLVAALIAVLGTNPDLEMIKEAKLEFAKMHEQLENAGASDFLYIVDQMESVTLSMFNHFQTYNSVQLIFLLFGLIGVILMSLRKKAGFHFYIIYSIGLVLMPYFFNPMSQIPTILTIVGVIYGAIWVFLYSRNLHWFNQ